MSQETLYKIFKSPVINASGPMGNGYEYLKKFPSIFNYLGAFVFKSVTRMPCAGNDTCRVHVDSYRMINSVGIQNIGIDNFIKKIIPPLQKLMIQRKSVVPLIMSIAGDTADDYAYMASKVPDSIAAIEINISCSHIAKGGIKIIQDVKQVTRAVCDKTSLPVIVKLPYLTINIKKYISDALDGGASILSMINSVPAMMKTGVGGLSGPSIKPLSLRMIYEARAITNAPIIGIGGICSVEDVRDYFRVGANIVGIGTAIFTNPHVFLDIYYQFNL